MAATSPSPPSPKTSSPRQATNPDLLRTPSVRFSSDMPRSFSPNESSRHTADSSADEITPIVTNERRAGGKNKNYDTTSTGPQPRSSADEPPSTSRQSSTSSARSRRTHKPSTAAAPDSADAGESSNARWWKDLAEKYGSIELENKGSVARDHLALERTFLAWLRTSLAFASIGIAITQLFRLNTTISEHGGLTPTNPPDTYHLRQVGKPLGATFLGIAILVLLVGGRRYFESQYWIVRGKFPASRGSVFLITGVAVGLIVTSLVVVCVVDPSVFEKR